MRKSELLSLPSLSLSTDIIDFVKNEKPEIKYYYSSRTKVYKYTWFYKAKVFLLDGKNILKVSLFSRHDIKQRNYTARYDIFISKEYNKYLTYDTYEEKWRTAKIDNLNSYDEFCFYPVGRCYCDDAAEVIINYIDNGKSVPYESIFYFQSEIKDEHRKIEHKRITDHIDAVMELVSELPNDFDNWIEDTAMIHSRYIYYNYSRNVKVGYCTHCGHDVDIVKPKHNTPGRCNSCKSSIIYKAIKKAAVVHDEGYGSIVQKTKEGYILRYFEIKKCYSDFKSSILSILEAVRVTYDQNFNSTGTYEYAEFKNTGVVRWCKWEQKAYSYNSYSSYHRYVNPSTVYHKNLKKIFADTEYRYSSIDIFAKGLKGERFYLEEYLSMYSKHKFIEYLVKQKLFNIVNNFISKNWNNHLNVNGKRIHEVLKVSKEQVKMLTSMDASMDELRVLQMANKAGVKLTKEQIKWIAFNMGRNKIIDYMKYSTAHKVIKYIKAKSNSKKLSDVCSDYVDYLECCEKLGYDLVNKFIFFPKDLNVAHDIVIDEWESKKKRIKEMGFDDRNIEMGKIAEELIEKYAMKDKRYCIRIPWTCEEIKNEGQTLHHCVGNYVERVLTKETIILFIRENHEVDKPFYTMELNHDSIIQVRGMYNCSMTSEVNKFVEKFKAKKLRSNINRKVG